MLGKRRILITNKRTVCRVVISVYPHVKYPVALGVIRVKVIVGLKIVHDKEVGRRKAPDRAYPRTVRVGTIDLINSPIVSGIPLKLSRIIALGTKVAATFIFGRTCIGVFDGIFISAEINLV